MAILPLGMVGLVVSTTIDKYFYVFVNLNGADSVQVTSSDYRTFFRQRRGQPTFWDGDLALPRAFLHQFGIEGGVSLFLASEVPPRPTADSRRVTRTHSPDCE